MVMNPIAPQNTAHRSDLELIDFTREWPVAEAVKTMREEFGVDVDIYALGFSLGSNHLLRHLGAHKDCDLVCKIRAAVSISGAFELSTTAIDLKTETFGFYDNYMLTRIR